MVLTPLGINQNQQRGCPFETMGHLYNCREIIYILSIGQLQNTLDNSTLAPLFVFFFKHFLFISIINVGLIIFSNSKKKKNLLK